MAGITGGGRDELEVAELITSNQSRHCHVNIHSRGSQLNHLCGECDPAITASARAESRPL